MIYSPKPDTRPVFLISGVCAALGVVLFYIAGAVAYPFAAQAVAVFSFTAALFVLVRYYFCGFSYSIGARSGDNPALDFVVTKTQNTKKIDLCRMGFEEMYCFFEAPKNYRKADELKKYRDIHFYNYCVSMFPKNPYVIVFREYQGGIAAFLFEPDEKMVSLINEIKNREG